MNHEKIFEARKKIKRCHCENKKEYLAKRKLFFHHNENRIPEKLQQHSCAGRNMQINAYTNI